MSQSTITADRVSTVESTTFAILVSLSFSHMLNDTMQSLVPAIYPILKTSYGLDFGQLGLITLAFYFTSSLLQPLVGFVADKRPMPYSLPVGMGFTLTGLFLLSRAASFPMLMVAAAIVGIGSSVFHPESSRVARMASGGRHGLAQSLFQVGGNTGSAIGPLLAAFVVVPHGQRSIAWFMLIALLAMVVLTQVGHWYARKGAAARGKRGGPSILAGLTHRRVMWSLVVLGCLIFSKFFYIASLSSYYTLYLISKFHVSTQTAEVHLFFFLGAMAVGTLAGGPIGDRVGRKLVIWVSILGVSVHLRAAVRQSVLDGRADRGDRADPVLGVRGDPGLRDGTDAREGRDDRGHVLWLRVRHGRSGGCAAGATGGCDEHRVRLPGVCVPAADRDADGVPAEYRAWTGEARSLERLARTAGVAMTGFSQLKLGKSATALSRSIFCSAESPRRRRAGL